MKIVLALSFTGALLGGCSNAAYNQQAQPSDITGFYSKSSIFMTATNTTALQLNSDGTGFECIYSNSKPQPRKTPVKHIGGNQWASATFGTAEIKQVGDNEISWGAVKNLARENIENTSCDK